LFKTLRAQLGTDDDLEDETMTATLQKCIAFINDAKQLEVEPRLLSEQGGIT
jgi:hypothetical protein